MLTRTIVLALLVAATKASCGAEMPLKLRSGHHAPSPNRQLYVHYDAQKLEIRDAKTSRVQRSMDWEEPVIALRWTGDSKTLVVVELIPTGSFALFVHWNGHQWVHQSIEAPFQRRPYDRIAVVDVKPHRSTIDLTYKTYLPTRLISFRFIPGSPTGDASHIRRQDVTVERWRELPVFPFSTTNASNPSLQPTAGRSDVPLRFIKTPPLQHTLAPASGS